MDQQVSAAPQPQKLPAGLAGMLNGPEENRDSAYFSGTDASSKHTSAASCIGVSPLSAADKTPPPPLTTNLASHALASPGAGHMSVASMVSPTTPASLADQRRFERPLSLESVPMSATLDVDSRRESVDSRFNQGFGDLRLGNSPYASHNHSTTSIPGTLPPQQRPQRPGLDSLSVHRISNGYQPAAERVPEPHHPKVARTAPAITGPATSTIARAAEPTKGQAWAFPEEDIQRIPSVEPGTPGMYPVGPNGQQVTSRRSSVTDSLASSQYTSESRLPPGQRRLDDSASTLSAADYQRLSSASGEFPSVHHHSLQHKQLGDLRIDDPNGPGGAQPYSRTPELRVSHKLAERKRRTEMKELFDQLRDLMPQERGSKASKWEILTKAIAEHKRKQDECEVLRTERDRMEHELSLLRQQLGSPGLQQPDRGPSHMSMGGGPSPAAHAPLPHHPAPPPPSQHGGGGYHHDAPSHHAPPPPSFGGGHHHGVNGGGGQTTLPSLPSLRALNGGGMPSGVPPGSAGGGDSMTGVQYDRPRSNGMGPSISVGGFRNDHMNRF